MISTEHSTTDTLPPLLETAILSDAGPVRGKNEDSVAAIPNPRPGAEGRGTLLVVSDGLGGHNAGEVASAMAVRELSAIYYAKTGRNRFHNLKEAIAETNRKVFEAGRSGENLRGMSTTLVAGLVVSRFLILAHVGDSRGYLFREGRIIYRTLDHSLRGDLFELDSIPSRHHSSHILTQAMGSRASVRPSFAIHRMQNGDSILLCSDGLTGVVSDEEIREIVTSGSVQDAAEGLVGLARTKGAEDDVSILLSRVIDAGPQESMPIDINDLDYYYTSES